jgi:hypothetical protein
VTSLIVEGKVKIKIQASSLETELLGEPLEEAVAPCLHVIYLVY